MNGLVLMGAITGFCTKTSPILQIVGWALTILKVGVPLIIIALGLVDLAKAAVSSKPEEIKKCATSLLWRLVGGIALFFIPTIVMAVLGFVSDFGKATNSVTDYQACYDCIVRPWNTNCVTAVNASDNTKVELNGKTIETQEQTTEVEGE